MQSVAAGLGGDRDCIGAVLDTAVNLQDDPDFVWLARQLVRVVQEEREGVLRCRERMLKQDPA